MPAGPPAEGFICKTLIVFYTSLQEIVFSSFYKWGKGNPERLSDGLVSDPPSYKWEEYFLLGLQFTNVFHDPILKYCVVSHL